MATGRSMGIGNLGGQNLYIKRKFRWSMTITVPGGLVIPESFCKISARPNITIEETELNFLHDKIWLPGKASWETITVTYIDVATTAAQPLYNWLSSVYQFGTTTRFMGSTRNDYAGQANIFLYDGCGNTVETWQLNNVWPTGVNFGDLDMSSSETVDIELTLRYSDVTYQSVCPNFSFAGVCNGCTGTT